MRPRPSNLFRYLLSTLFLLVLSFATMSTPATAQLFSGFSGDRTSDPVQTGSRSEKSSNKQRSRRKLRPTRTRTTSQTRKIYKSNRVAQAKVRGTSTRKLSSRKSKVSTSDRVNRGRVGLISGGIGGTYIRIATDLASVLNDGEKMRILPIVGQGSVQNITDILYLRGVDVGIVQSDVLAYIKARKLHRNIDKRIQYITKLYNEEFHLIGGREIKDIRDLEGKAVNFGVTGSGTFMTASTVFEKLGIDVEAVNYDQALAIEKIRTGEIAATVFVAGKPASAVSDLKSTYGLRLIPVPYDRALQNTYLPARFSPEDYPELVPTGETVNSIAVGAVMAVYNWSSDNPRRQRAARFVETFFSRIHEFRKEPRHKKWREVNLAATLPGWRRFRAAKQWLEDNTPEQPEKLKISFSAFLDQNASSDVSALTPRARNALFRKFLEWQRAQQ